MTTVHLGLGSNLGDRAGHLRAALSAIADECELLAVSSLYETDPVGPPQPMYFNAAAVIETDLSPRELLDFLKEIERGIGRDPDAERNSPRPIDLDILVWGDLVLDEPGLTIPHPRMSQRRFVLAPLAEIAGDARDPSSGRTVAELLSEVDHSGVEKIAESGWERE